MRFRCPPRALAALMLCAALPSCAALTTMTRTPGTHPSVHPLPIEGTTLFDWKGVVHCHSHLSHDCDGRIEDIVDACHAADIDFVVMTDHQSDASIRDGARGRIGGTLFVVGAEKRTPQGTLIAFPLTRPLRHKESAAAMVAEAHEQGAIALVCHGELWHGEWDVPGLNGAEIVNLHAGAMTAGYAGTLATALALPLRMLFRRISLRDDRVLQRWDRQLAWRHPFAPVGGNDAHASVRVFGPLGGTIGTYREVFLTLSTHVLAETLDETSLVEAIRLGRTYVSFDVFGEGAGFDFRAIDDDGVHVAGATVTARPGLRLRVRPPRRARIELWRDGAVVQHAEAETLEVPVTTPGVYRAEVRTLHGSPWLFSGSIRVLAPGDSPAAGDQNVQA